MGMGETRVQAATLLCKIFLHHLVLLSECDGMLDLWLKILDIMESLMKSGQADSLVSFFPCLVFVSQSAKCMLQDEAVPESIKNILLVMADGGFLKPPAEGEKSSRIWKETWNRVDRFLPDMFRDIFPETRSAEGKPPEGSVVPETPQVEARSPEPKRDRQKGAESEMGGKGKEEAP